MRDVELTVTVEAGSAACFAFIADHTNTPRFMRGIKRYEPIGSKSQGKGARFVTVAQVAGRNIESELEITGWSDGKQMVASSVKGPKTRGSWTFAARDDSSTDITLKYEYEVPGILRLIPSKVVEATIEGELKKSLGQLKKLIEAEGRRPSPTITKRSATGAARSPARRGAKKPSSRG